MQWIVSLETVSTLSESGFSLDELVVKTKELFEEQGMAGFVSLLLSLVDEAVCVGLLQGRSRWKPQPCCKSPSYELVSKQARQFRTSIGKVKIHWRRIRCNNCGKSLIPLREFMGIKQYQSKTAELERIVAEVVSEQSYRRTSQHLNLIGEIPAPKSTLHRWVMESECDQITLDGKLVDSLFADGTGYKRRPDQGGSNRGELRVVLGVRDDGTVVPFGAWSGESWKEIAQQIRSRTFEFEPAAKVLISDGEQGLAEGLSELANEQQRCHWHSIRDLDVFMWMDKARIDERKEIKKRLAGVIGIELPEEDFEKVQEEDKEKLKHSTAEAENKVDELIDELSNKGYTRAARYIQYSKNRLFTYVRLWLKYGLVSPRASSMIERMMREIGRRLKRIAHGWSESGAAKMARIIIKRITSSNQWDDYWKQRLRITGNVMLVFRKASVL